MKIFSARYKLTCELFGKKDLAHATSVAVRAGNIGVLFKHSAYGTMSVLIPINVFM